MFPFRHPDPTRPASASAPKTRRRRGRTAANGEESSHYDIWNKSWDAVLEGGGVLQMAMKGDLLDFFASVEPLLAPSSRGSADQDPGRIRPARNANLLHCKIGSAFQAFLAAFGRAKIALLHTKLAPPICDKGSYSQLIYATCLSLLRDAMDDDEPDQERRGDQNPQERHGPSVQLVRSAFALFTLYAMYETNPLKRADDRIPKNPSDRMISMLPTSLSYPREYMHVRRAFHRPIRVDVDTYRILTGTLPDLAREQVAWCESARCRYISRSFASAASTNGPTALRGNVESDNWGCTCALAQDVLQLLGRLMPHLDLVSYSGPCGLEAMAGHPDYPWKCVVPNGTQRNVVNGEMTIAGPCEDVALNKDELTSKMSEYLHTCSAIRFPVQTTQRMERVREGIRPIFGKFNGDSNDGAPVIAQLVQAALNGPAGTTPDASRKKRSVTIERRHVTFSIDVPDDRDAELRNIHPPSDDRAEMVTNDRNVEVGDDHWTGTSAALELVLPVDLTELQEQSLTNAVKTLLMREDLSRGSGMLEGHMGDVSTLGGTSALESRASGVGRSALQALLSQAGAESATTSHGVTTGDFFLGSMADDESTTKAPGRLKGTKSNDDDDGDMSDLSDDGLSIAASAVGRKALDMLIAKSTQPGTASGSIFRSTEPRRSRMRRSTRDKTQAIEEGGIDSDDESIPVLEDASMAASTIGQKALTDLLQLGQGENQAESDDSSSVPTRQTIHSEASVSGSSRSSGATSAPSATSQGRIPARAIRKRTTPSDTISSQRRSKQRKAVPTVASDRVTRSKRNIAATRQEDSSDDSTSVSIVGGNGSIKSNGETSRGAGQQALDDLLSSL